MFLCMKQEYYFDIKPKFSQNISSIIPLELNTDNCITCERKKEVLIIARNVIEFILKQDLDTFIVIYSLWSHCLPILFINIYHAVSS